MNSSAATEMTTFTLGEWLVEPSRNRLSRNAHSITIENKSMDVLVLLASHAGDVLSNDDIIDTVWNGRPMGENPVYKCIANLRSALGDDPKAPRYIETIPRKGYRLVTTVSEAGISPADSTGSGIATRKKPLLIISALAAAGLILLASIQSDVPAPLAPATNVMSNSIAVLPFENLSSDVSNDFFCHGIADELLNRLAGMPGLRVVARRSSFSLGDRVDDIPAFAKRLGVHYVLSGSVRQSGDSYRINARLLDRNGTMLWSDSYDRDRDDLIALQDDVASAVAKGLALHAGDMFRERPARTENFDAYSSYLVGNELQKRRPGGWGPRAIAAHQEAIRLDPSYAAPYAGLAMAYLLSDRENPVRMRDADNSIDIALQLSPNLAEGHAAAGLSAFMKGSASDYRNAEVSLNRAIKLNPSLTDARGWLSTVLVVLGQESEALQLLEEAITIDPLNPILNMNLGRRYHADGRLNAAREQLLKSLQLPDTAAYAWTWVSDVETDAGRLDAALDWMKQAVNDGVFDNEFTRWYAGAVAQYYARLLMFDKAEQWMAANDIPAGSHWRLGHAYYVFVGQKEHHLEFEEEMLAYEATVSTEKPLTLLSRSLIGRYAVRSGDYDRGIRYLQPIFTESWTLHNAPGGSDELITTLHFLAIAMQRTGQTEAANVLLENVLEKQLTLRTGQTKILGQILAREAITYSLIGEPELALERFEEAVDAGWRNYYLVPGNPCWDEFRGNPVFASLLSRVKQDIDLQRERVIAVERIHPFDPPEP